jgi:glucose/arabinose dehydrogenase/PKD repeat protein
MVLPRSLRWRGLALFGVMALLAGLSGPPLSAAPAANVDPALFVSPGGAALPTPPDFSDTLVTAINQPTALTFTPDGRMLITTQTGALRIYQNNALVATPALDLAARICDNSERGLLGVAVDPAFASNHLIYLYYTFNKYNSCATGDSPTRPVNRVARFVMNGNTVDPASELVLVDNILSVYGNHNAGDLHFGADGLLYVSIGDGGAGGPADDLDKLAGKILRINGDGTIPAANPYAAASGSRRCGDPAGVPAGSGPCREIFAYGLRNPFRIVFKPGGNDFYINDVGQDAWEEIDSAQIGANYGWPTREGPCDQYDAGDCGAPPAGMTNPLLSYNHNSQTGAITDGCGSITGGAFVPAGIWPAAYAGSYLFSDYVCGKIFRRAADGTLAEFVTGLGGSSVVTLLFGPAPGGQALYYTNFYGTAGSGQVRRIAYTGSANQAPNAVIAAAPTYGAAPLSVAFDGSGSADPDGDALTYAWDFGDGGTASGATPSHIYAANGVYSATLTVHDSRGGASDPATQRIDVGNSPPQPAISAPSPGAEFAVGQQIVLQGSATDPQQGALPSGALSWTVVLHHIDEHAPANAHTHPFMAPTAGSGISFSAPPAEDLAATALSYLEIRLSATDALGLTSTVTQALRPHRVALSFASQPAGFGMQVNNQPLATPNTVTSWENYAISVRAPLQSQGGQWWACAGWADAAGCPRTLITPAAPATYTAIFQPARRINLPLLRR